MRKFIPLAALALAITSNTAWADFLGLYVGGGSWNHEPSGQFGSTNLGSDAIDVESNLGFSDKSESYLWAAFDHPIPLVPNIRLEMTSLGHSGSSSSVNFGGVTVSGASVVNLDSVDTILYYRLLDNWVNLDVGLNLRKVDGEFTIGSETLSLSETVPMIYLAAQFDLPFTGFSVGADYSNIDYDGNKYDDLRIRALYEMGVIGFEAGLRSTQINLDDVDQINADLEFEGIMLGLFLHF